MNAEDVLWITLDSCRFDTFDAVSRRGELPVMSGVAPLHKATSPSHFTYGSHAAFWMGFTPGVVGSSEPWLNPKAGKLFRMAFSGHRGRDGQESFRLEGENIIDGFRRNGYFTVGTGAVDWFDSSTPTGAVLGAPFQHFYFSGNTWSLASQLAWIDARLAEAPPDKPRFVFLNVGETHVPYWFEGAPWLRWPSPCVPFGGTACSAKESSRRQQACLAWVDQQLAPLINRFSAGTVLICADHGDCWGEDGLWEHGISHPATLTVPLLIRFRGMPLVDASLSHPNTTRFRSGLSRLQRWWRVRS